MDRCRKLLAGGLSSTGAVGSLSMAGIVDILGAGDATGVSGPMDAGADTGRRGLVVRASTGAGTGVLPSIRVETGAIGVGADAILGIMNPVFLAHDTKFSP